MFAGVADARWGVKFEEACAGAPGGPQTKARDSAGKPIGRGYGSVEEGGSSAATKATVPKVPSPVSFQNVQHLSDASQALYRGWISRGHTASLADEMAQRMVSVGDYETKLAESEMDLQDLEWNLLKATHAGAGASMGDYGARSEALTSANDRAIAASVMGCSHSFLDGGSTALDRADDLGDHAPPTASFGMLL